jgi:uncharacterized membrane protein YcaP (DUF421 family)
MAPVSGSDLVVHAAKTVIILVVIATGLRLLGKREMAQLNLYDLTMLMAAANAVQNAMTGGLGNLSVGLVCSATVIATGWLAARALSLHPQAEARVVGTPTIVVRHGHVLAGRLRAQRITRSELDAVVREHNIASVDDVALAVLEVDGSLSIIASNRTQSHRPHADPPPHAAR